MEYRATSMLGGGSGFGQRLTRTGWILVGLYGGAYAVCLFLETWVDVAAFDLVSLKALRDPAANLLHHVDAPATVVQECRRVLTPGGRIVGIECAGHRPSLLSWIRETLAHLRRRGRPPEDHHHLSADDLATLITDAGFTVQETTLIGQRRPRMTFVCLRAVNAD